ncbi:MAG TPA: MFS transporter [Acetobacteraceae bacterium]|jgi:MFS family permease|nr:MFS transporter [Acetobacteraceae bacterium]
MPLRIRNVPRTIWALGFVSMFMDISSEMTQSLLPVFLVTGLGASPALLGLIEGVAQATASITKVFSGWLSDRLGRRKLLTVLGYGFALITKPIFPFAATPYDVLAARFLDRIGKGVRDAPRDALVADVTPQDLRGAGFGLRQSLDTMGAIAGPLAAIGLMAAFHGNMRIVFSFAIIPAVVSVAVLVLGVKEPNRTQQPHQAMSPISWSDVRSIGTPFWVAVTVGVLFTMAGFSEAFLVLRGAGAGIPLTLVPFVMIVMNVVYALVSAPVGSLSDRVGRKPLLASGIVVLLIADIVLALAGNVAGILIGVALWGLHLGLTQGLLSALVADTAPARLRGTAFGLFNLATGVTMIAASVLAGAIWTAWGASLTFLTGGGFAVVALFGVLALLKENRAGTETAA